MIPCHQREDLDFFRLEASQIAVLDQIVRVFVVTLVTDVHADIVQDRCVLEPLTLAIGQAVDGARLIEQRHRQPGHLLRVFRPVIAPLGQLEDAAPPDVRIAIGLRDLFAMLRNVIQDSGGSICINWPHIQLISLHLLMKRLQTGEQATENAVGLLSTLHLMNTES